jgi:hypothetical protein
MKKNVKEMYNPETFLRFDKAHFDALTDEQRFVHHLLEQFKNPVIVTEEADGGAESVCAALYAATGFEIAATPDELCKNIFTVRGAKNGIRAAFFFYPDFDDFPDDYAIIVSGVIQGNIILNRFAKKPRIATLRDTGHFIGGNTTTMEIMGLDKFALQEYSRKQKKNFLEEVKR